MAFKHACIVLFVVEDDGPKIYYAHLRDMHPVPVTFTVGLHLRPEQVLLSSDQLSENMKIAFASAEPWKGCKGWDKDGIICTSENTAKKVLESEETIVSAVKIVPEEDADKKAD